jgi:hypothetical protein
MTTTIDPEPADWVIALRLVQGVPTGRAPTRKEIILAVWFLLDQGHNGKEIERRTRLSSTEVTSVVDLRRAARPNSSCAAGRRARARAARPHWRHILLIWGHYTKIPPGSVLRIAMSREPSSRELVGAGT